VPLQISLGPSAETPRRTAAPAASIDIAPTLLELAEAEPCIDSGECRPLDGLSLAPLLDGRGSGADPDWRNRPRAIELALDENNEPYDRVCEYYGIRSGRWAWVEHVSAARPGEPCRPSGETELYDLSRDPQQLENLAGSLPAIEEKLRALARALRDCEGAECTGRADQLIDP
jgi:arylsulfatase A-like enzyme